ncbi:septum formation initiator family protein [Streptomyces sp. NPDC098789]|uniref:FtsB family cell division protein n=1 Tax=Streptomyces sp. NPDC098789 TaxID=3366098 RepID=UPI0037FA6D41
MSKAGRTPFVLLVVVLLAGGLISLLLLNSALNQGSFQLSKLKKETTSLTDEQQALQRDVDAQSAPDALERRARELGLVPGGSPVFLGPDGKVSGTPTAAEVPPPPSPPPAAASGAPQSAPPSGAPSTPPSTQQSAAPAAGASGAPPAAAPGAVPPPPSTGKPTPNPGR